MPRSSFLSNLPPDIVSSNFPKWSLPCTCSLSDLNPEYLPYFLIQKRTDFVRCSPLPTYRLDKKMLGDMEMLVGDRLSWNISCQVLFSNFIGDGRRHLP